MSGKNPADRFDSADAIKNIFENSNFSADYSKRILVGIAAVLGLVLASSLVIIVHQRYSAPGSAEQTDALISIDMDLPFEKFVRWKRKLNTSEWQLECRKWFQRHLQDNNVQGLEACLDELEMESWKEAPRLLSLLHSRNSEYIRIHQATAKDYFPALCLNLQIEVLCSSWTDAEKTMKQIVLLPVAAQPYKTNQFLRLWQAYGQRNMTAEQLALLGNYGSLFTHQVRACFLNTLGCQCFYSGRMERARQCFRDSANELLACKHIEDYDSFRSVCKALNDCGQYRQVIELARCYPPSRVVASSGQAYAYLEYARAFLESARTGDAEKIMQDLAPRLKAKGYAEVLFCMQDLQIMAAMKAKDPELVNQKAKIVMKQFLAPTLGWTPLTQDSALLRAWCENPKLAQVCLQELNGQTIKHPLDLAIFLTSYAHHLRNAKNESEATGYYKLAHKYFDLANCFYSGRVNAFIGEAYCYLALHKIDEADACVSDGKKYLKTGKVDPGLRASLAEMEGAILRHKGKFEAAATVHKQTIAELFPVKNSYSVCFGSLVSSLVIDYQSAGKTKPELEAIEKYLPLLDRSAKDLESYIEFMEKEKRRLSQHTSSSG